jgi:hypothetical protein
MKTPSTNCASPGSAIVRSTVTGAKNEAAVLNEFSKLSYVKGVFECGLLESKLHPWMVASINGVAVFTLNGNDIIVVSVEIKTRVAMERVDKAQQIATNYQHKLIACDIGDETWKECVEKEHSMQVLLQLWVMKLQTAFYIAALLGTSTLSEKFAYIVMGHLSLAYANDFVISWIALDNC